MSPEVRPLGGLRVGLSVAGNPEDLALRGFTEGGLRRLTVRLTRALLAEGAGLAFGHDWREGGIMEAIANIALDYQGPGRPTDLGPPILNFIPWPDTASATGSALLSRLKGVVEVNPGGLPDELRAREQPALDLGRSSEEWRYLRARGLTHLRRRLIACCSARVALGGKLTGFDGRLPGIVEEVFLTLEASQPVFLAGILGGAAEVLGKVLLGIESARALRDSLRATAQSPLVSIYSQRAVPSSSGLADSDANVEAIVGFLAAENSQTIVQSNGLSREENLALLQTDLEEELVTLVLTGLKRKWNPQTRSLSSVSVS